MHDTNLLGLEADLLGEALDFLCIANKMASLLCDDTLSVVLQPKDIAHLIHASLPLWVKAVLDRVQ
jgi:hypothetical protein